MDWRSKGQSGSQQQQPPPPPQQEQQGGGGGKKRNRNKGRDRGLGQDGGSERSEPHQGRGPQTQAGGGELRPQQDFSSGGPPRGPPAGQQGPAFSGQPRRPPVAQQGPGPRGPPPFTSGSGGPPRGPPAGQQGPAFSGQPRRPPVAEQGPGPRGPSPFTSGPRNAPPPFTQSPVVEPTGGPSMPAWGKPGQVAAPAKDEGTSKDPSLPQPQQQKSGKGKGKGKGKKGGEKQADETHQAAAPAPTPAPSQAPLSQPEPKTAERGRSKKKITDGKPSVPSKQVLPPVIPQVQTPVRDPPSLQLERKTSIKSKDTKTPESFIAPPMPEISLENTPVQVPTSPPEAKPSAKGKGKKRVTDEKPSEPLERFPSPDPEPPIQVAPQTHPPLPQPAQRGKGKGKPAPSGDTPQDRPTPGPSKAVSPVQEVTKQMQETSITWSGKSYVIPRRPQGQSIARKPTLFQKKFTLEVNYLPIDFKNIHMKIFHYDVDFKPDRPKSLYRPALRLLLDKYVCNRHPAFDGKKNMYAAGTKLQFPSGDTVRDTVKLTDPERGSQVEFDITVKLVHQDLSLSKLAEYLRSGTSTDIPQDVIQGVDIALRNAPTMNSSFVPVGRSFFAIPRETPTVLGGGFELWHGHYQSAIMSWKPYLNVDVANKAFPISQSLLDFINQDLDKDPRQSLDPGSRYKLLRFVKGLKIDYKLKSSDPSGFTKRTYKVNDLGDPPKVHKFKPDKEGSREITVEQYFRDIKKIPLEYPHLPTIVTSNKNYLPLEFCHITPNQAVMRKLDEKQTATMVRSAAKGTDIRKDRIMRTIGQSGFNADPCAREFGIQLNTNFENVEAHVLKPPDIRYANAEVPVRNGVWQMRNREQFINSPGLKSWAIINTDRRTGQPQIQNLIRNLISTGSNIGIPVDGPLQTIDVSGRIRSEADFEQEFRKLKSAHAQIQIVVVIMTPFGIDDIYSKIKRAAELKVGIVTQCLKSATCGKMNPMTALNILLKINSKLSGVNHALGRRTTPAIFNQPVMIVGADVTHPAPGSEGLSIAAVAASHDVNGFKYNMLYRLQPGRQEMIENLQEMIEEQLKFFFQQLRCKPKRILYYRDGVSEGQFLQVLNIELRAIRAACKKLEDGYEPAVTFLVVQKRHHTRFFPSRQDWDGDKNKNVCAGTLVDTKITHPTEVDFYLVSHQSIQGTARPTKYHLLWDDNKIDQDDLEQLTYYLCHLFARCNRSVSYPAPTYYAHLAAFRARAWWDGQRYDSTNLKGEQETKGKIQDYIVKNAPMFFV